MPAVLIVRVPNVAKPSASVVAVTGADRFVEPGVRVTGTPGTPLPLPSSNFTWTGGVIVAPAVTVAGGCWEKTILPGVPGVFVSWKGTENAPTPAVTVKAPAVPLAVIGAAA